MVQARWKVSAFSKEPTNTVISATKPEKAGKPRFAKPATTYPTLKNGMIFIKPPNLRMSRVCVLP